MIQILLFLLILEEGESGKCNFTTFDSAQLDSSNFYGELNLTLGTSYAFGFWVMSARMRKNYHYTATTPYYNETYRNDGYHLFNFQVNNVLLTQVIAEPSAYNTNSGVKYNINFLTITTKYGLQMYSTPLNYQSVEGKWIFLYCVYFNKAYYEFAVYNSGDGSFYATNPLKISFPQASTNGKIVYGGEGQYTFPQGSQTNLRNFPGRISKPMIFSEAYFFYYYQLADVLNYLTNLNCFMPTSCPTQNETKYFDTVYEAGNLTMRQFSAEISGTVNSFEFWIKRDRALEVNTIEIILEYGGWDGGQEMYRVKMEGMDQEGYYLLTHVFWGYNYYPSNVQKSYENSLFPTNSLFSWCYFKHYFERTSTGDNFYFQGYTSIDEKFYYIAPHLNSYNYYYSNFIGTLSLFQSLLVDEVFYSTPFQGYIANFKMTYCASAITTIAPDSNCHSYCQTCKGPTKWDCKTCYSSQNRYLNTEQQLCICNKGYSEILGQLVCQKTTSNVLMVSQVMKVTKVQCQYGYFSFLSEEGLKCLPCPYQNETTIQCINCLLNSELWSSNPICDLMYETSDNKFYTLAQITQLQYFTIKTNSVKLCQGCDTYNSCFPNRIQLNGKCIYCALNCALCGLEECVKCESGYYLMNGYCYQCPVGCADCIWTTQVECTSCAYRFALVNIECHECGQNCEECELRVSNTGQSYLKCLWCSSTTYPSLDGVSCYQNTQNLCKMPFQFSNQNSSINTLFYQFQPQLSSTIQTGCILCESYAILNLDQSFQCIDIEWYLFYSDCYLVIQKNGVAQCALSAIIVQNQYIYGYCYSNLPFCQHCFDLHQKIEQYCLYCEDGYYDDYKTNLCLPCPEECSRCYQSDSSKVTKILSLISINQVWGLSYYEYLDLAQDLETDYISLFCTVCQEGYHLQDHECLINCPNNCYQCTYVNKLPICISCFQIDEYSQTILNGQCVTCPTNCKLCNLRTAEEQTEMNPYFSNENFTIFSNQCVVPIDGLFYFDQQIKQFVNCEDCEKYVDLKITIHCDSNFVPDNFNMKIENLFKNTPQSYLNQIETDEYFLYLNTEYVKYINYKLSFTPNSICTLSDNSYFASLIQQNVFNVLEVNLMIDGNNSTLILAQNLVLSNFTSIQISNLNFNSGALITENIIGYSIQLENITIQQKCTNFQFNSATSVVLKGFLISKILTLTSLIAIESSEQMVLLTFSQFKISESQFQNTSIFSFQIPQLKGYFTNIKISKCKIIESQFQSGLSVVDFIEIDIQQSEITNSSNFFSQNQATIFDKLTLIDSDLLNSVFIKANSDVNISRSSFSNLQINGNSTLLLFDSFEGDSVIVIQVTNFVDITYQQKQAILSVQQVDSYSITVNLSQLNLVDISLDKNMMKSNYYGSIEQSIYYIDCDALFLDKINIKRGLGFSEFSILNALNFVLSNSNINLDDQYKFKSIYPKSNCTTVQVSTYYYRTFMYLNNVFEALIEKTEIQNIMIYDSVFVDYKQTVEMDNSVIRVVNCNFISNIIHQTQTDSRVSLIKIESFGEIKFENDFFDKNLLYISLSESTANEGMLFSASSSICSISKCTFTSNMIINGQSSIFQIDSTGAGIESSVFQNNSIFVYETLKQFVIWGFEEVIYQEDLETLFPIKSFGGNGNLKAVELTIFNSQIVNSRSSAGGAFAITMLENGNLDIFNSSFQNLIVDLSDNSQGGCFYITSNSQQLSISISQSTFQSIQARQSGGFLFLQVQSSSPKIHFTKLTFSDIFAIQGSLVYVQQSASPSLWMKQCSIQLLENSFQTFINNLEQITNVELTILTQYFTLIYFTDGMIDIENLSIRDYPFIQFLYTQNSVQLVNVEFINIKFARPLLTFNSNEKQMKIKIDHLTLSNCSIPEIFVVNSADIFSSQNVKSSCDSYPTPDAVPLAGYMKGNANYQTLVSLLKNQIIEGVIQFNDFKDSDLINLQSLAIQVKCSYCEFGLIGFVNTQSTQVMIQNLKIYSSECGTYGCLHINSGNSRLLSEQVSTRNPFIIKNLFCAHNTAEYGGCIYLKNSQITITDSQISNNFATEGGAIYISGTNSTLDANQLFIINNSATEGSGVFSTEKYLSVSNGIHFSDNKGQTISTKPSQILIQFFQNEILTPIVIWKDQYHIKSQLLSQDGTEVTIYLPTGIEIQKYRRFSMKSNSYSQQYQILRLYALTDTLETTNLTGTYCNCWIIDSDNVKYSNMTNKDTFYFDEKYYDLSDLILFIPQDKSKQYWLQFSCNSVFSPVIVNDTIIDFHQNYTLQAKVKPYECQLGEYHEDEFDYCHPCLEELKQYSTTINSTQCQIQNEEQVNDITAAQVKLNKGYWKYSITSSSFDLCFNNQLNCVGGWNYGNDLCLPGHIGALCEQCDAFNTMGYGAHYLSNQFECQSCNNSYLASGAQVIGSTVMFVIFLIFFSLLQQQGQTTSASLQFQKYLAIQRKESIQLQYFKLILQYFQIVSLTSDLYRIFDTGLQTFIDIIGNSFQMGFFNYCYLTGSNFDAVYFDILQNSVILFAILSVTLIVLFTLNFLRLFYLSKQQLKNYAYLIYIFYGCSILRCFLKLISFRQVQDVFWIYQNVSYKYTTSFHQKLVFAFLIPFVIVFGGLYTIYQFLKEGKINRYTVTRLGIWYVSFKNCKFESFKLITIILTNICIIFVDGDNTLRCLMAFTVLTFYYQYFSKKQPYWSSQLNLDEERFIKFSISIMVLNVFWKVATVSIVLDIIITFSYILIILSLILIIQGLLRTKIIPYEKIMRKLTRLLIKYFSSLLNINLFYKYSEAAEKEKKRRFELLRNYLIEASRRSIDLRKK